jgi:hypothetical protein
LRRWTYRIEKITYSGTSDFHSISFWEDKIHRVRWTERVEGTEKTRAHITFYIETLKAKDNMEDVNIDGRITLRDILKASNVKLSIGFSCALNRVCSEHGNKCSGTINDAELQLVRVNCRLFQDSATLGYPVLLVI